ncbi:MAG: response regulator [Nitrospira sp.]|nr:response regulator [Nitrospira sp.]
MAIGNMPTQSSSSSAILLIEPDQDLALAFRELIAVAYHASVTLDVVSSLYEGLTYLQIHHVSLILMNLSLPDDTGQEAVARVRRAACSSAVIGFHRTADATMLSDAIRAGAHEVLPIVPPSAEVLRLSITSALIRATRPLTATEPAPSIPASPTLSLPLAKIAHDLNNSLTSIKGYTDILLARLSAEDPAHHCAEQIKLACGRAENLIKLLPSTISTSPAPQPSRPIDNASAA